MAAEAGDRKDGVNGINITPLVDVCLVLVLIFMVTMPLSILRGIDVKRQTLQKYGLSTPQENVTVHLTSGRILVKDPKGRETPVNYEDVAPVLDGLLRISSAKQFFLKVDRDVAHGRTVWVMDLAKQSGAADISLLE